MARKMCLGCGAVKAVAEFSPDKLGKFGRRSKCKACEAERVKRPKHARLPLGEMPKRCAGCKKTKKTEEFYKAKYAKDGLTSRCKVCHNAQRQPARQDERRRIANKNGRQYQTAAERSRNLERNAPKMRKIKNTILRRLRQSLRNYKTSPSLETLLGYSLGELRHHIERSFRKEMNWERFFAGYIHIDHIVPAVDFDLSDADQIRACFALSNLRPLWAEDNIKKGANRTHLL